MLARLLGIRPEDRRDATVAFLTFLGMMTAHAVLETARDALFLSKLPAKDLPWAYIAMAGVTFVAASGRRLDRVFPRRVALPVLMVAGGVITASFGVWTSTNDPVILGVLYVWTGVLATLLVVEFWLRVADALDFGQAKRLFAFIGAGGSIGAIAGAAAAGALLMFVPPRSLLFVSGGIFAATAAVPFFLSNKATPVRSRDRVAPKSDGWFDAIRADPYVVRLLWVALLSSMVLTGVDFVFKAEASVDIAPDQLGPFFARFYAFSGGAALAVQLFVAPRLLRVLGVNGSLVLLPILLLFGSSGFALTGGLGAAIAMRGADSAFRYSVHRTGTEILFVPLSPSVRDRFKGLIESVGQRGGQALASVLLLATAALGERPAQIGLGLVLLSGLWVLAASSIKPHYLELFRKNLRRGAIETHVEVPDLDLHSLEALIAALSSPNDYEVLASLDLLAAYGKANLIPPLILYHPSPEVVLRAFTIVSASNRPDLDPLVERMMRHENPDIRAAALRYSAARSARDLLESMAEDPSPLVRTTAVVELIQRGVIDEWKGGDVLRNIIDGGSPELRRALAVAARGLPRGRYAWALIRLAFIREPDLAVEVARSMAAAPDVEYVPTLVRLLSERDCREDARSAILLLGDAALDSLDRALSDSSLPRVVRRHIPGTIARFRGRRAAEILERHVTSEQDDVVRTKIVRSLGRLRGLDPSLAVSERALLDEARATLERAVLLLLWRVASERFTSEHPKTRTATAEVLAALLADLESMALESVFRILKIVNPSEEFEKLYAGLRSADPRRRENGRELLSHVVPEPLRTGILAMVADEPPPARLERARRFADPDGRLRFDRAIVRLATGVDGRARALSELWETHVECLRRMLLDPSDALRGIASYRIAELGLGELAPELRARAAGGDGALAELTDRAVDLLDRRGPGASRVG